MEFANGGELFELIVQN